MAKKTKHRKPKHMLWPNWDRKRYIKFRNDKFPGKVTNISVAELIEQAKDSILKEVRIGVRFPRKRITERMKKKYPFRKYIRKEAAKQSQGKKLPNQEFEMIPNEEKDVNTETLVNELKWTPLDAVMPVTLSDNYGDHFIGVRISSMIRANEAITRVLGVLRSPEQLLPNTYYHLYQVFSPTCMRKMPPNEKITKSQVMGVQNYTYLVRRDTTHYKVEEDLTLSYCRELLGKNRSLQVWRFQEIKEGRLRVLRAKITTTNQMLWLLKMLKNRAFRSSINNMTQEEVTQLLMAIGCPSDPMANLYKKEKLQEPQMDQDGSKKYYIKLPRWHWGCNKTKLRPHSVIRYQNITHSANDLEDRQKHGNPDYGYLQRFWHYCSNKNLSKVMEMLKTELLDMNEQYTTLLSTPPETLYAEEESTLLDCLYENELKAEESHKKHEQFLKTLERQHKSTSREYFCTVQKMRTAWDQYQRIMLNFEKDLFIVGSYVTSLTEYIARVIWHNMNGRLTLVTPTINKIMILIKRLKRALHRAYQHMKKGEALKMQAQGPKKKKIKGLIRKSSEPSQKVQVNHFTTIASQKDLAFTQVRPIMLRDNANAVKRNKEEKFDQTNYITKNDGAEATKCNQANNGICELNNDEVVTGNKLKMKKAIIDYILSDVRKDIIVRPKVAGSVPPQKKIARPSATGTVSPRKKIIPKNKQNELKGEESTTVPVNDEAEVTAEGVNKCTSTVVPGKSSFYVMLEKLLERQRKHFRCCIKGLYYQELEKWHKILKKAVVMRREKDLSDGEKEGLKIRRRMQKVDINKPSFKRMGKKNLQQRTHAVQCEIKRKIEDLVLGYQVWELLDKENKFKVAQRYNAKKVFDKFKELILRFVGTRTKSIKRKRAGTVAENKRAGTVAETKRAGTVAECTRAGTVAETKRAGTVAESKRAGTVAETKRAGTVAETKRAGTVAESKRAGTVAETKRAGTVAETKRAGTVAETKRAGTVAETKRAGTVAETKRAGTVAETKRAGTVAETKRAGTVAETKRAGTVAETKRAGTVAETKRAGTVAETKRAGTVAETKRAGK
nr:uncharacterized protein LOC123772338 [Procambarus clarkii]